jgi:hypothetical protein
MEAALIEFAMSLDRDCAARPALGVGAAVLSLAGGMTGKAMLLRLCARIGFTPH